MQQQRQIPVDVLVQQLSQIPGIKVTKIGDGHEPTFGEWGFKWLNTYKRGVVKDNTFWSTYYEPLVLHLVPVFGDCSISSITTSQIQDYFKGLRSKLALETQKKIRSTMWQIYEAGIDERVCFYNPVRHISLKSDIAPATKNVWTLEQYQIAYEYALSHPNGLDMITLMETAISRSELLGLTKANLDRQIPALVLTDGLVAVRDANTGHYELVHDGLKNNFRKRTIPISPLLATMLDLKPMKVMVRGENGKMHEQKQEYIFHAPHGGPYDPTNWYRRVERKFMADLHLAHPEVPTLTTHELRHTRATLLKNSGTDLFSVARLLGHRNLDMLAKRYAHDDVGALKEALKI